MELSPIHRLPHLDTLKALGMALIVLGHVDGGRFHDITPPIQFKQLGVACFVMVAGFGLARERRSTWEALYRRLFDLVLFGLGCALTLSLVSWFRTGNLRESDYLPFLLGANVVAMDAFPANPTTWFLGTYIHILLVWALLLRGWTIRPWMLVTSLIGEIVVRAWLMTHAGLFIAYMALPNWITLLLLGMHLAQGTSPCDLTEPVRPGWRLARDILLLGILIRLWPELSRPWFPVPTFPFMGLDPGGRMAAWNAGFTSTAVSTVYLSYALALYRVVRWIPGSAVSRFFARNTILIFVSHMPLRYGLLDPLFSGADGLAIAVRFLLCYVALGFVSELILRIGRPDRLRARFSRALMVRQTPLNG
jgi:peptidoglycan/LPS O-acetylase OafA/YrhL